MNSVPISGLKRVGSWLPMASTPIRSPWRNWINAADPSIAADSPNNVWNSSLTQQAARQSGRLRELQQWQLAARRLQ